MPGSSNACAARRRGGGRQLLALALSVTLTAGLTAGLTVSLPPLEAAAAACPASGAGTAANPYRIESEADFALINGCGLHWHYVQTVDLDLGNVTPVGTVATPFSGSYRGVKSAVDLTLNEHRRVTLAIDTPDSYTQPVGLFSRTRDATISHLTLAGTVTGLSTGGTGALIGTSLDGLVVSDVTSSVTVRGRSDVGGLIGSAFPGLTDTVTITRVTSSGSVMPSTASSTGTAGGLIGTVTSADEIRLTDVVVVAPTVGEGDVGGTTVRVGASGGLIGMSTSAKLVLAGEVRVGAPGTPSTPVAVVGHERAGGFVGNLQIDTRTVSLGAFTVHADVSAAGSDPNQSVGGLVGSVDQGTGGLTITGPAAFTGSVIGGGGSGARTGGAIGRAASTGAIRIEDTTIDATISAPAGPVGGVIAELMSVTRTGIGAAGKPVEVRGTISGTGSPVGGVIGTAMGLGTDPTDGLHIHSAVMLATITATSRQGTGGMLGVVQGSGGERAQLTSVRVGTSAADRATITMVGTDLGDGRSVASLAGGLVGWAVSDVALTIEDSEVFVTLGAQAGHELAQAGGLVGTLQTRQAASIRGNVFDGVVSGENAVGGIVGDIFPSGANVTHTIAASGVVPNTVKGTISGTGSVGGAVGIASGAIGLSITDIAIEAAVSSTSTTGGVLGRASVSTLGITDAVVSGDVTGGERAGGVVGEVDEGVAATLTRTSLSGTVTANAADAWDEIRVGGVVGSTREIITAVDLAIAPGATVRAVHPNGTADGAVFVSGGLLLFDSSTTDPASVDMTDVAGLAGLTGMAGITLDLTQVSQTLRDAGRCVVSTTATLTRWTQPEPGVDELQIRRVDPPATDPCPPPAGGFAFRFVDDDDAGDGDGGAGGTGGTAGVSLACDAPSLRLGATVTCTISGAPPAVDIVWRASVNPTVAQGVARTGAAGAATFTFVLPRSTVGRTVSVELVDWTAPLTLGVVGGAVPTGVPAGSRPMHDGILATVVLGLLALAAAREARAGRGRRADSPR